MGPTDRPTTPNTDRPAPAGESALPLSGPNSLAQLPRQAVRSGAITLVSTGIQIAIGIGGTVVLARVLTPADFGLVAMTAPITGFVLTLRDFGLALAVIQHRGLDARQVRSLSGLNLKLNLSLTTGVAAVAPLLAWFYGEPRLAAVTLLLAVGLLILSLNTIPLALLRRQMRFGTLAAIELGALALALVVAVVAALHGLGFWSLVLMNLVLWSVLGLAPFVVGPWRGLVAGGEPDHSISGVRSLISFGSHATGVKVATAASEQVPFVLVGYFFGTGPLGFFHRAVQFSAQPFLQIYGALLNVSVVAFSQLRDHPHAYRDAVRKGLLALFSLTLPALTYLIVAAPDVVALLLGPQWAGMILTLQLLSAGMVGGSLTWATRWVYFAEGRPRDLLAWMLLSTPVVVAATAVGAFWGHVGVAIGYSVTLCVLAVPSVWFCLRGSQLRGRDFWRAVLRPATASGLASTALLMGGPLLAEFEHAFLRVIIGAAVFGLAYTMSWVGIPGGWRECDELVLRRLRAREA